VPIWIAQIAKRIDADQLGAPPITVLRRAMVSSSIIAKFVLCQINEGGISGT
jgi:hypothetical protein